MSTSSLGPIDRNALLHDTILQRARLLAGTGQPSYAVLAAQTAFEIDLKSP